MPKYKCPKHGVVEPVEGKFIKRPEGFTSGCLRCPKCKSMVFIAERGPGDPMERAAV